MDDGLLCSPSASITSGGERRPDGSVGSIMCPGRPPDPKTAPEGEREASAIDTSREGDRSGWSSLPTPSPIAPVLQGKPGLLSALRAAPLVLGSRKPGPHLLLELYVSQERTVTRTPSPSRKKRVGDGTEGPRLGTSGSYLESGPRLSSLCF